MHSFSSTYHPERIVDISRAAERVGFSAPVAISRVAYEHVEKVLLPCPCIECKSETEPIEDVIERIIRTLAGAVEGGARSHRLAFAIDIKVEENVRKLVPLRAEVGPAHFDKPVIVITLLNEIYETPLTAFYAPSANVEPRQP